MMQLPVWARFGLINGVLPWGIAAVLAGMTLSAAVSVIAVYVAAMLILILNVGHLRATPEWRGLFFVVMLANLLCTMLFANVALVTAFGSIWLALRVAFGFA